MSGSLFDAERLVAAIQELGGTIPVSLVNILTTADMLNAHSVSSADPATAIVKSGAAGNLSEKKLGALLAEAAQAQMVGDYIGNLRASRIEPLLAREFGAALRNGAANDIIGSLRQQWEPAADFIGRARSVISAESSTEHFLQSADAGSDAIELWQGLNARLDVVRKISLIVAEFSPRSRTWPMFKEYPAADNHLIESVAVMCTNGYLPQDSAEFRRPDPHGHKSSPYYRLQLKLHSISEAQSRYATWCAGEWDRLHGDRDPGGYIDPDTRQVVSHPRPVNPFREEGAA